MGLEAISSVVVAVCAVLGTACGGAWFVVRLHTRTSDEKHEQTERRLAILEAGQISNQAAIQKMSEGVATLLERTKHMGES